MDWDDYRYLLALARGQTLARAAEILTVTHTTVGRRLHGIETRLGTRLFDRTPDGFVPTEAGRELCEVAEQMESEVLAAEGRVLGRDTALAGPLRVSAMDLFVAGFADAFATFVKRHPAVELTLSTPLERVSLTRREADVALRLTNRPPEHLVGRKIGTVQFAVYAADHLVSEVGADKPLSAYPWLGWDEGDGRWLDAWLAEHAPGARYSIRLDDHTLARRVAVQAGIGVHFLACFEGDSLPGVRRVSPVIPEFSHGAWLLTLPELRHTRRVVAFMDHLQAAFAAAAERLAGSRRARPG